MADPEIRCVLRARALNGESPVWSAAEQRLYWIDTKAPALHRFDPATGANESWPMPSTLGCAVPAGGGRVLLAMREGLARFDCHTAELELIAEAPFDPQIFVANDGLCDPQGRLWFGTMVQPVDERAPKPEGFPLVQHHPQAGGGHCTMMTNPVRISNGLAWSPDGATLYHADTPTKTILAYPFHPPKGTLGAPRVFAEIEIPGAEGPDGAAVDAEGGYWSAIYGAGRLLRFTPDGTLEREVHLPVKNPTMCAFGGPDLRTLYLTSAAEKGTGNPLAGSLLAFEAPFTGLPAVLPHPAYFTMPGRRVERAR